MCIRDRHGIGLINLQYIIMDGEIYVIEVNPRAVSYTHLDVYKRQESPFTKA